MAEPKVTKDMGILEIVEKYPESVPVFQAFGMHCFGCMAAHYENIEQGCVAHGIDADEVIAAVNNLLEALED